MHARGDAVDAAHAPPHHHPHPLHPPLLVVAHAAVTPPRVDPGPPNTETDAADEVTVGVAVTLTPDDDAATDQHHPAQHRRAPHPPHLNGAGRPHRDPDQRDADRTHDHDHDHAPRSRLLAPGAYVLVPVPPPDLPLIHVF